MRSSTKTSLHRLNILVVGGTAVLFTTIFILSAIFISRVNETNLRDAVYQSKEELIYDTVNNQVADLDQIRLDYESDYTIKVSAAKAELDAFYANDPINFSSNVQDFFNDTRRQHFYVYLYDHDTDTTLYQKSWLDNHQGQVHTIYDFPPLSTAIDDYYSSLRADFASYEDLTYADYRLFVGVPRYYIERQVSIHLRNEIYHMTFSDVNTYMWVNKIINFAGGDDYAYRVIHPNLKETEYVLPLSTHMLDYSGQTTPYLTELNGVNDEGEVFFTYTFKLLNSEQIGTKLTYAKLYEPYGWVIAMGVYLDDVNPFIIAAQRQSSTITVILVVTFLLSSVALFISIFLMIERIQKRNLAYQTQNLRDEIDRDQLTSVRSRKAAIADLEVYFDTYQTTKESVAIMLFDFDYFKEINDNYGHDAGDQILRGACGLLRAALRTSDHLYRLGGDEFVIIFQGLKKENAQMIADNLIRIVKDFSCQCDGNQSVHPSISIGVTYFKESDQNYLDALKRADKALYVAKKTQKGTAFVDFE